MTTYYKVSADGVFLHTIDSEFSAPYSAVTVVPPSAGSGNVLIWTSTVPFHDGSFGLGGYGQWVIEADNRNLNFYNTSDGSPYTLGTTVNSQSYNGLGAIPSWLTTAPMPAFATWTNGAWVVDTAAQLAAAKTAQINALSEACATSILSGFTSNALGTVHTYPSKATDQQNLSSSVLASLMPNIPTTWTTPFWCADSNNNWAFVNHTASQIQQVGEDAKTSILTNMAQNATLAAKVQAATTIAAVQAITWVAPA